MILLLALIATTQASGNPGILLAVPFPLNVPQIPLELPLPVEDIVINRLELRDINVRQVDYKWQFGYKDAEVKVSWTEISFKWSYKQDQGSGFFREDNLKLNIFYSFISSESEHLKIKSTSTRIYPGHSKVTLGGSASQIVIVEVTNLILNHASFLFRDFLGRALSQTINSLTSFLEQDQAVYTDPQTKQEFYVNTTMVAPPILSASSLLVQLNGAPYLKGTRSQPLNPEDILVKTNSSKIQVQIHQKIIKVMVHLFLQLRGGQLSIALPSKSISSTIEVNSVLLSPVFPRMSNFQDDRDVVFNIKVPEIQFSLEGNRLKFSLSLKSNVVTHNSMQQRDELYIQEAIGKASFQLLPIFGNRSTSLRIADVSVLEFNPSAADIEAGLIAPEAITKYFGFLTDWLADAINFELNRKLQKFSFRNILAVVEGQGLPRHAYYLQIQLTQL